MAPFAFRSRFIAALPPVPPELNLHLDEFVDFDASKLCDLAPEDADFLAAQGLPRAASPFLSFSVCSPADVQESIHTQALPLGHFPIGQNGSGDLIAIETVTREVVYLNHDANNARVFINSTLPLFAECICIYQEHLKTQNMAKCLATIEHIDRPAAVPGSMWHAEVMAEVNNG